jgi:DNA-binding NtrC family response regulator
MAEKRFRGDLYTRMAEIVVDLPTLAERAEDVLPLLLHFLGEPAPPLEPELAAALLAHSWPWNVRELKNIATQLRIQGQDRESLGIDLVEERLRQPISRAEQAPVELNQDRVRQALRTSRGRVAAAARDLGCSRRHLYRLMERFELDPDTFRAG